MTDYRGRRTMADRAAGVRRYRRKPVSAEDQQDQFAARYEPGAPLDDLLAVARMADGELAEVVFPSCGPVLLARLWRFHDEAPRIEYVTVEPGHYLAYSSCGLSLYESDDGNWGQFYDLLPREADHG
jgi:hypothetical protein